jgi:hypothetical protein
MVVVARAVAYLPDQLNVIGWKKENRKGLHPGA